MESHNNHNLPSNLIQESLVPSDDDRDVSPSRKHHKVKQKRKASTISLKDNGKTKSSISTKTNKSRPSLAQTNQDMSDALTLVRTWSTKSSDGNHLSTFEELHTECEDNAQKTATCLTHLTLDGGDMTQRLQRSRATSFQTNEHTDDGIHLTTEEKPRYSKDGEQANMELEDKLAQNNDANITGIINLSSTNLTDNDMHLVIQRAFLNDQKKCTGLLLRDNDLTSNGVKMLVDVLLTIRRPTLKYLSFSNNPGIGDVGMEHVAHLLQNNQSITFLALPQTSISDRGVRLLADALCGVDADASCPSVEKLYISYNKLITDESLEALLQILEQNQTLKVLSVEHCGLSDAARKRLRQAGVKKKKKKFSLSE